MQDESQYTTAKMAGWAEERSRFFHSYIKLLAYILNQEKDSYPRYPSTAISSESDLPCWIQGLKKFIRLEESPNAQRIEDSKCNQEEKHITG